MFRAIFRGANRRTPYHIIVTLHSITFNLYAQQIYYLYSIYNGPLIIRVNIIKTLQIEIFWKIWSSPYFIEIMGTRLSVTIDYSLYRIRAFDFKLGSYVFKSSNHKLHCFYHLYDALYHTTLYEPYFNILYITSHIVWTDHMVWTSLKI